MKGENKIGKVAEALATAIDLQEREDILIGHAQMPSESRALKWDRKQVRALFTLYSGYGSIPLDELAAYIDRESDGPVQSGLEPLYVTAVRSTWGEDSTDPFNSSQDRDLCRFYNRLTPDQEVDAWKGGSLPMRRLSPAASAAFEALIRHGTNFKRGDDNALIESTSSVDGVPYGDILQCSVTTKLMASRQDAKGGWSHATIDDLAKQIQDPENDGSEPESGPKFGSSAPWALDTFSFLGFSLQSKQGGYEWNAWVTDHQVRRGKGVFTRAALPPNFQAELNKALTPPEDD